MTEAFPTWALLTFLTASGASWLLEDSSLASCPFLGCLTCPVCLWWHITSLPRPAGLVASSLHGDRLLTFCPLLLYTSTLSTRIFHSADSVHLVPNQCPPYRGQWTHMYTYKIRRSFRLPCHLRAGVQQINKRDQSNKRDSVLDSAYWFWEADIILGWLSY